MSIEIRDIDFSYDHNKETGLSVLNSFSLSLDVGKTTAILGASGSGKSTILKLIAGLLEPSKGSILIDGKPAEKCRELGMFGLMFQTPDLLPWRTLGKNVQLPQELQNKTVDKAAIDYILKEVGLLKWHNKYPHELSGGMQQRASLARALIAKPNFLLLDEPFSHLDELLRFELLFYVQNYAISNQATVILVTHDITEAVLASDFIYVLSGAPVRSSERISVGLEKPRSLSTVNGKMFYDLVSQVRISLKNQTYQLLNI